MGMDGMMGMMGPWMMLGGLVVLLVLLGAAVAGGIWLGWSMASRQRDTVPAAEPALAELSRRYAAGEIDREEYLQRKVDME